MTQDPFEIPEETRQKFLKGWAETGKGLVIINELEHPKQEEKAKEKGLPDDCVELLIEASRKHGLTLIELYQSISLDRTRGAKAIELLQAEKMVALHSIRTAETGKPSQTVQVIGRGLEEVKARGITPKLQLITRGSWTHYIYGIWFGQHHERLGSKAHYEKSFGDKIVDCLIHEKHGAFISGEVTKSGSPKVNALALQKVCSVPGVSSAVCIAEDKKLLERIRGEVSALPNGQELLKKIRFAMCYEFRGKA